jgi:hypothetical protein
VGVGHASWIVPNCCRSSSLCRGHGPSRGQDTWTSRGSRRRIVGWRPDGRCGNVGKRLCLIRKEAENAWTSTTLEGVRQGDCTGEEILSVRATITWSSRFG